MIIEDLMKKPIVIERDLTLTEAAKLIIKHNISSLVVVSGRAVIGIITYEDLVRHFGEQKKVFEIMTKQVITVKKSDKVQKAKEIMQEKKISILPVVDKNGQLVGIVHAKDILREACDGDDFLMD